jgi:predicted ABC-type ATPase
MPELHVVAGPNGVGKSSTFETLVPAGTDYINADLIAKEIKAKAGGLNTQDIANQEASQLFYQRVKDGKSFAIETNLCDVETYKSFQGVQSLGYQILIYFLAVYDVQVCIDRVKQRVSQGGHNVNPDVIKERYTKGLALLKHYKAFPDSLVLLDNIEGIYRTQAVLNKGIIQFKSKDIERWAQGLIEDAPTSEKAIDKNSIDEIRKMYKGSK